MKRIAQLPLALLLAACTSGVGAASPSDEPVGRSNPPSGPPATTPGDDASVQSQRPTLVLPTKSEPTENGVCPAAALSDVILRLDSSDAPRAYVDSGDRQLTILWPYGFTARLSPGLELLNEEGVVVAKEGDALDLMGGVTDAGFDFFACKVFTDRP